jgi:REP element-mobilizing transposase RayT
MKKKVDKSRFLHKIAMSTKYFGKFRNESIRAQFWDYGWNGAYFITICTKNRVRFFGEVVDGTMNLSPAGQVAHKIWFEIGSPIIIGERVFQA